MLTRKSATKNIKTIAGLLALSAAPNIYADFDVYTNDWPNNQTVVDEKRIPPPKHTKPPVLNAQQKACKWEATTPRMPDVGKLYLGFGGYYGPTEIRHVTSDSIGAFGGQAVYQNSLKKIGIDWEVAAGTAINKKVRFEVGYVYHKTLNYNPNPVLVGSATSMVSQIYSQGALVSMYIDFRPVDYFMPYIGVLTGVVWNKTRTTATGGPSGAGTANTQDQFSYPWGLMAGARMPILSRYFVYLGYRYVANGNISWQDSTTLLRLKGKYVYSGFNFGVQILVC